MAGGSHPDGPRRRDTTHTWNKVFKQPIISDGMTFFPAFKKYRPEHRLPGAWLDWELPNRCATGARIATGPV